MTVVFSVRTDDKEREEETDGPTRHVTYTSLEGAL
jgi:hypothetical protein